MSLHATVIVVKAVKAVNTSQWSTRQGPIEPYILAGLYSWLEAHSGLSHTYTITPTSTLGANANISSFSKR
ncbi:MAG: hypothetical protein WA323_02895 [Candidatus Nitrosopolaris sp.]